MGTGYTRNDTGNNIADGNVINASDLDGEFDAIQAAFNESTGHTHDGTSAEGAPITKLGPSQNVEVGTGAITPSLDNTVDLGSGSLEFKDLYIDGTANIDSLVADTADINAGTIDGTTIGGSSPAAATVTTLTVNGNTTLGDAATDTVTFTADVASNVIPSADDTYDLGASGSEWKDLYIDGTANIDSLVADTADINGGTIDGVTIGGAAAGVGTFTTANATTVDTTNLEVTNIKAKDGTAAVVLTDSTGAVAVSTPLTANGGVVFNDAGADVDFRVEGDTDANLLFVDASTDRVGIGPGTPSAKFHVATANDSTNLPNWFDYSDAIAVFSTGDAGSANSYLKLQTGFYNSASTNNIDLIVQNKDNNYDAGFRITAGSGSGTTINNGYFAISRIATNGTTITSTERMRIDSSGNVLVGGTSAIGTSKLQVHNSSALIYTTDSTRPTLILRGTNPSAQTWNTQLKVDSSQNWYMIANPTETVGVYMTPSASGWNNLSDERAKKDWVELDGAVSKVMNLRAGTFAWVKDDTLPRDVGLIAQDVFSVLPEAVDTSDPDNWGVRYTHTIPLLVKAIQELKAELDTVKAELATLKGQ